MIITKSNVRQEQTKAYFEGDQIVAYHTEDIAPILKRNVELSKDENKGWSKDKHFRYIGSVSFFGYECIKTHHPEIDALDVQMQQKAWHKVSICEQCRVHIGVMKGV